jgi:uncharacterized protein YecE (DUF72 family)
MGHPAVYDIARVDHLHRRVWIIDKCDSVPYSHPPPLSITNDVERVAMRLHCQYEGYRIYYKDTMGNWDEIVHAMGIFMAFLPARDAAIRAGMS